MYIPIEAEPPTRSDRKVSWTVGGVVAAVFVGLLLMSLGQADSDPTPPPPVKRVAEPLTPSQETYLVYGQWLQSAEFADCMGDRGFAREAVAGTGEVDNAVAAAFLGIESQPPDSWLAPAEARNGRPASEPARAAELNRALDNVRDGGCQGEKQEIDIHDDAAVSAAILRARDDAAFTAYLAEGAWFAANPASALLYRSHLFISLVDPSAPRTSDRWTEQLSAVMAIVDSAQGWSLGPTEGYADFAQAVAIAPDGSMVVVRVGDPDVLQSGFVRDLRTPLINCGDVGVLWGAASYSQVDGNPTAPYAGLNSKACDAID